MDQYPGSPHPVWQGGLKFYGQNLAHYSPWAIELQSFQNKSRLNQIGGK